MRRTPPAHGRGTMVIHEERLEDLVLAAVAGRPRTAGMVAARLRPWLEDRGPGKAEVEEPLQRHVRAAQLSQSGSRFSTTPAGLERLQWAFGGIPFQPGTASRLVAPALSMSGASEADLCGLGRADGLRAAILRAHFDLDVPVMPTRAQVEEALGWALFARGAEPSVVEALRPRGGLRRRPALAVAILVWSAVVRQGGLERPPQGTPARLLERGIARLSAQAVGAVDPHPRALTRAILRSWLRSSGPVCEAPAVDDDAFPSHALQAARSSPTGRFGDHLVLISHALRRMEEASLSLDRFKAALLRAHQRRALSLKAADMPQLHDPSDLAESEVRYRRSRFHFIRI